MIDYNKRIITVSDILREIDEDLRQDKLKALWKKYGILVITIIVAPIIILSAFKFYQNWETNKAEKSGSLLLEAIEYININDFDNALLKIEDLKNISSKEYVQYATVIEAAIAVESNDIDQAIKLYETYIENSNDSLLKGFALIKVAYLKVDSVSSEEIKELLLPILEEDNSLYGIGLELIGYSYYKNNDYDESFKQFELILNNQYNSPSLLSRASIMYELLVQKISIETDEKVK
ncbi:MAG: hypothetical protein ACI9JG_001236 [Alphaproteobacteria bacterium]